jgi:hypothetical protein
MTRVRLINNQKKSINVLIIIMFDEIYLPLISDEQYIIC